MVNNPRRLAIQSTLQNADAPITASVLAQKFQVSRQTIVGDIALLRAAGEAIVPSPQGYKYLKTPAQTMKVVCRHFPNDAHAEMALIIAHGGLIKDVEIEHPLYGFLKGELNIDTNQDIALFEEKLSQQQGHLLSELTNGVHTHTISAASQKQLAEIKNALKQAGYLY
ncbi:transcription repressor NadR [Lapidilactobacillus wuchangensis]|uniref:transcription repressor NadR n=1 Tax=Lapidilactobacillus wuchangensis TaxID=2486001 RepID=UPI000F7A813F|nr:transcription repressor NadR [Lapidilactobacillus wuchangensis]